MLRTRSKYCSVTNKANDSRPMHVFRFGAGRAVLIDQDGVVTADEEGVVGGAERKVAMIFAGHHSCIFCIGSLDVPSFTD
jgi:hypothetical protein